MTKARTTAERRQGEKVDITLTAGRFASGTIEAVDDDGITVDVPVLRDDDHYTWDEVVSIDDEGDSPERSDGPNAKWVPGGLR